MADSLGAERPGWLGSGGGPGEVAVAVVEGPGATSIQGEVWADNRFAFYEGNRLRRQRVSVFP